MKNKKICIYINAYIANNLGDDMFVFSLCNHYPMVNFYIEAPLKYSNVFHLLENLTVLPPCSGTGYVNLLDIIDFQVFIGGSLFMEPKLANDIEKKFNSILARRLSLKIPCFIIGVNFEKYTHPQFFQLYQNWFKTLDGICFRDVQSYKLFNTLNNTIWAPDLIFTYKMPSVKFRNNNIVISPIYQTKRSGLPDFSNDEYFDFLSFAATKYLNMGFHIILAAFCCAQLDDIACNEIFNRIPTSLKENVNIISYKNDIESFLQSFLNAKYIIGTRFHSIILALKNRIPVFPIIYNVKTQNIIESYLFDGNYVDILELTKINFELLDSNRIKNYAPDLSTFNNKAYLHYHFLNEAILKKIGDKYDIPSTSYGNNTCI